MQTIEHMISRLNKFDHWGLCFVSLVAWLWVFPHVLVGLHWQDTSEFIAASRTLAVAHPPGHPLTLLSMHISQLLPWFDAAERAHLASSFWGLIGVGAMYTGLYTLLMNKGDIDESNEEIKWSQNQGQPHALHQKKYMIRLVAALGALSSLLLPLVWLQVTRAEVYAPQWAMTAVMWSSLLYADKWDDLRGYLLAAVSLGLLSANHTLLTAALITSVIPRLLVLRLSIRVWVMSILSYLIGLSLYMYLWLRGTSGGLSGWGWITDWTSWWETVSAKVWQIQVEQRLIEVDLFENCVRLIAFTMQQVGGGISLVLLGIIGLGFISYLRQYRQHSTIGYLQSLQAILKSWIFTLTLATILTVLTKLTYPFSESNPDFSGYLAAGVPSLILCLALVGRTLGKYGVLVTFTVLCVGAQLQQPNSRPSQSRGAEAWGRGMTQEVPAGGTLWTSFYASHFIAVALQIVEGWRADIHLVFRGHRKQPWVLNRLKIPPRPLVLDEIHTHHSLRRRLSRFEVERAPDRVKELWPNLTIPGDGHGWYTSDIFLTSLEEATFYKDVKNIGLQKQKLYKQFQLGDARVSNNIHGNALITDEDTAYAWALHFDMIHRWLELQFNMGINRHEIKYLMDISLMLRDRWIKVIAEEKWDSVDFSFLTLEIHDQ